MENIASYAANSHADVQAFRKGLSERPRDWLLGIKLLGKA
jgi:hypothetical protein